MLLEQKTIPNGAIFMTQQAQEGDRVQVHYTGRLVDGQIFDSSEGGTPLEFQIGSGEVINGFDDSVRGMTIGEQRTVEIAPADAYGERVEALMREVPREGIKLDQEPQVGMNFELQLSDGNRIPITITEVTDTHLTLDANHPLAGEKLIFDLSLVCITSA
jgi:peptidylprolyl isomerase